MCAELLSNTPLWPRVSSELYLSELAALSGSPLAKLFPAGAPRARAAELAVSPVQEAGVIGQEQEEHRGVKSAGTLGTRRVLAVSD